MVDTNYMTVVTIRSFSNWIFMLECQDTLFLIFCRANKRKGFICVSKIPIVSNSTQESVDAIFKNGMVRFGTWWGIFSNTAFDRYKENSTIVRQKVKPIIALAVERLDREFVKSRAKWRRNLVMMANVVINLPNSDDAVVRFKNRKLTAM